MTGRPASGRAAVIGITPGGLTLAGRLAGELRQAGVEATVFSRRGSLAELVRSLWSEFDYFVFVMAAGIVVRLIAPLIRDKWHDPGVVVVDEQGRFAISLLSGHWGGANELARRVASVLGGTPVVTTATDVNQRPAVDLIGRRLGFLPLPGDRVKLLNGAYLRGEKVVFYSEWEIAALLDLSEGVVLPWEAASGRFEEARRGRELLTAQGEDPAVPGRQDCRSCPAGLKPGDGLAGGEGGLVFVTSRLVEPLPERGICLCPRSLVAGIGCKRGTSGTEILSALREALVLAGRRVEALRLVASHVVKSDEEGLLEAARVLGLPTEFYDTEVLQGVMERYPGLQQSDFVRKQMGVGGVCETSALAAARKGKLVLPKTGLGKVTVALAEDGCLWSASGQVIPHI